MVLRTRQKSVLVLDDDPDIGNIFKLGLERKFDSDVFAFTDPILALGHFKINPERYGLVISDVRMPSMNGYEFVNKVKQINPDVKICLMSAFEVNDIKFDLKSKIDEFLQKPLSIGNLTELIGNMLYLRSAIFFSMYFIVWAAYIVPVATMIAIVIITGRIVLASIIFIIIPLLI